MARVRSPAYPSLSLSAAVDMIRKVYSAQQGTPEPREVVLKHMGYSGESGRALKSISSLIKYGFLEKHGNDGMRVSKRAISIIYPDPDDPDATNKALFDASREPALFQELFERWEQRPTENSLESYLIRKGFNVNAVESVARAFYETFDLVSGFSDSSDSADHDEPVETEEDSIPEKQDVREHYTLKHPARYVSGATNQDTMPLNDTRPIFDFDTVVVRTTIDNRNDLAELISRLQKLEQMLPVKAEH